MADRIVIDSAAFDRPYDDLLRLNSMIAERARQMRVSDLNWGRLTSWRTLLASFWDVQAYRPLLDEIDLATISYRSPNEAPEEIAPRALLMAGWLASRLGWEVVGTTTLTDGVVKFELRAGDKSMAVVFELDRTAGLNDGMVSSVVISAGTGAARFSVAKRTDGTKLETEAHIGDEHSVGRVLAYENRTEANQLSRELAFLSRDAIYEAALSRVAELVNAIRNQKPTP
jgi:glucose-6-phosphate dehydrogenase assembly protein OpcA